jgi:hypothetical protein
MGVHLVETVVDLNKKLLLRGLLVYRFGSGESPEFWEKQNTFGDWEPITDRDLEQSLDQELGFVLNRA